MNEQDLLDWARETGAEITELVNYHYSEDVVVFHKDQLKHFAELVALQERELCARTCEHVGLMEMSAYDGRMYANAVRERAQR